MNMKPFGFRTCKRTFYYISDHHCHFIYVCMCHTHTAFVQTQGERESEREIERERARGFLHIREYQIYR